MKKTASTAKKTASKTPSLRTLRRRFLAEQKVEAANLAPLSPTEYEDLSNKLEALNNLNAELAEYSKCVDQNRTELLEAETDLKDAEENLKAVRESHQAALREVAPLLNRLPTV